MGKLVCDRKKKNSVVEPVRRTTGKQTSEVLPPPEVILKAKLRANDPDSEFVTFEEFFKTPQ
jgi:hypothetical protein